MNIAIVGATGAVGEVLIELLQSRAFPVTELHLLASSRSAGTRIQFGHHYISVKDVEQFDFKGINFVFFAAGGDVSAAHAARAQAAGCVVIDKSSRFRLAPDVPLVVPEVNGHCLEQVRKGSMVASPNCSTAQLVMVLAPLHRAAGVLRVNIATYQAVSGAGRSGISALASETADLLNVKPVGEPKTFPVQMAFNVIPQVERMGPNGFTTEEEKLIAETRRILELPDLAINPTCVRVPVFFGHGQAVHIELGKSLTAQEASDILIAMPGLQVHSDPSYLPTPVVDAVGHDEVVVGRIRVDPSHRSGIDLWTVGDNTRKGAALNSVQIAERLVGLFL